MAKQIKYSEPAGYFPKELRDRIIAAGKAEKAKKPGAATPAKKAPEKTTKKK